MYQLDGSHRGEKTVHQPSLFARLHTQIAVGAVLAFIMTSCGGCGGDKGEEETTAEPSSAPMAAAGEPPPEPEDKTAQLMDYINQRFASMEQLVNQIDKKTTVDDPNNNVTGCGQILADGTIVQCSTNSNAQVSVPGNTTTPSSTSSPVPSSNPLSGNGVVTDLRVTGMAGKSDVSSITGSADATSKLAKDPQKAESKSGIGGSGAAGGGSGDVGALSSGSEGNPYQAGASSEFANSEMGKMGQSGGGGGGGGSRGGGGSDYGSGIGGSNPGGSGSIKTVSLNGAPGQPVSGVGDAYGGAMGSDDPEDYLRRIHPQENLFKVVERRYVDKALKWAKEDIGASKL